MKTEHKKWIVVAAAAMALGVVGCGDNQNPQGSQNGSVGSPVVSGQGSSTDSDVNHRTGSGASIDGGMSGGGSALGGGTMGSGASGSAVGGTSGGAGTTSPGGTGSGNQ